MYIPREVKALLSVYRRIVSDCCVFVDLMQDFMLDIYCLEQTPSITFTMALLRCPCSGQSCNVIYDALERRWRVTEAKGHNNPFEGPKPCVEAGFFDILIIDSKLMEPTDKVYSRKDGGKPQCTQYGLD